MKTLRMLSALVALGLVLVPMAQAADISVFFDSNATVTSKEVHPFEAFQIYIVMTNVNDHVNAVEYKLNLPESVIVTGSDFWGESSLNVGNDFFGVCLGLGECVNVFDALPGYEYIVVEVLECMSAIAMPETAITLTKFLGGSPAPTVSNPRYSDCEGTIFEMTPYEGLLTTSVGATQESWGAVKAMFN